MVHLQNKLNHAVTIILLFLEQVYKTLIPMELDMSIVDMIYIAFFFFLHPGKYTDTTTNNATFTPADVYLYLGKRKLSLATAMDSELIEATSCALYFTTQKNHQRGDVIVQLCSLHQHYCPIKSLV